MAPKKLTLQPYPREKISLLADSSLFPLPKNPFSLQMIETSIRSAFERCTKNKKGVSKSLNDTPEKWVHLTLKHLKERSDPILSSYFVSLLKPSEIFEFDAVSYEMQRHRMTIGVFYQYLILELMKKRWHTFDGSREGDIVADIESPSIKSGLRLYVSVKKSYDTVGGQDIGGVIRRLENMAKEEKNLTKPYLCVICVATPSKGKLSKFEDRKVKTNIQGQPYSLNCEIWGPAFVFPFITGVKAEEIYLMSIKQVAYYIPFMTLKFKDECSRILAEKLDELGLVNTDGMINPKNFMNFIIGGK